MIDFQLILVVCLTVILLLCVRNRALVGISLIIIGLNLIGFTTYLIADFLGRKGFNEVAIAHLKYLADIDTLIRFWPLVALSLFVLFFLIGTLSYVYLLRGRFGKKISQSLRVTLMMVVPLLLSAQLALNPLSADIATMVTNARLTAEFKLPPEFQSIDLLAPPIRYQSPEKKPNFIIIFAESLENAFYDSSVYPGLLARTNQLINEHGALQHQGIRELTLSNWTDSGLVAATCGASLIPNYSKPDGDSGTTSVMEARMKSTELIGETCLGDILSKDGYEMSFVGGSEFGWASKNMLFSSQGFEGLYSEAQIQSHYEEEKPVTTWGVFDDTLFDFATQLFDRQTASETFGLALLTVDTHIPGYISPKCGDLQYKDGSNRLLNAFHCSDLLISEFISSFLNSPEHEDTVIFLISDHLFPGLLPDKTTSNVPREYHFAVFNSHLSRSKQEPLIARTATPLDIAPTILAHLGYEIDTLNFGRNLYGESQTLAELMGLEILSMNVVPLRHIMRDHWEQSAAEQQ